MVPRAFIIFSLAVCCMCDSPQLQFMKITQERFQNDFDLKPTSTEKDMMELGASISPVNNEGTEKAFSLLLVLLFYNFRYKLHNEC